MYTVNFRIEFFSCEGEDQVVFLNEVRVMARRLDFMAHYHSGTLCEFVITTGSYMERH